ncbi:MAG: hypothetical protein P8K10_09785 [Crocinitomicaceae bacterium]|nr:hypothetical protein [Crocinitomicaceae bacterium]
MTYKQLKEKLENLNEEQLNQQVAFEGAGLCGSVAELKTAEENWFCNDWSHPGMYLDTESRMVKERQYDKKDWGEDDWIIYGNWFKHLQETGTVLRKGDIYFEVKEDHRIQHKKFFIHNVDFGDDNI